MRSEYVVVKIGSFEHILHTLYSVTPDVKHGCRNITQKFGSHYPKLWQLFWRPGVTECKMTKPGLKGPISTITYIGHVTVLQKLAKCQHSA